MNATIPMKTQISILFIYFAASLALGFSQEADPAQEVRAPVPLEVTHLPIPQDLKHLLIQKPYVDFLLLIDETGVVKDFVATASNHAKLLPPAQRLVERLHFEPAQQEGKAIPIRHTIRIHFEDFQQQAWRDSGQIPMGSVSTDGTGRKFFDQAPSAFAYTQSEVTELDVPLQLEQGALRIVEGPEGQPPAGSCTIEFYIDSDGVPRLPSVLESDSELASLSGLASLQSMQFKPLRKDLNPTYVKVRQRFQFGNTSAQEKL